MPDSRAEVVLLNTRVVMNFEVAMLSFMHGEADQMARAEGSNVVHRSPN